MVRLVTPPVKPVRSPTTPAARPEAPLTTDAAKSDPGICGRFSEGRLFELPPAAGAETAPPPARPPPALMAGRKVGS